MSSPRIRVAWLWVLACVVCAAVGVLCGRWAFTPPSVATEASTIATTQVSSITIGQKRTVTVSVNRPIAPLGVGAASGTITSIEVAEGAMVDAGAVLYRVNLRPVVVAQGTVPAFRDLAEGAVGDDVTQLQNFLVAQGLLREATGTFRGETTAAVRAWQASLGVERTGVVLAGDLIFAETLPAFVVPADSVRVGSQVAVGDVVLNSVGTVPEFRAVETITGGLESDKPVQVALGGTTREAKVGARETTESSAVLVQLTAPDGSPLCPSPCDVIPFTTEQTLLQGFQVVVPDTTGLGVPVAAVWFRADGSPYVVDETGTEHPITIEAQGQGQAIISGVADGTTVRLADQVPPAPAPAAGAGKP